MECVDCGSASISERRDCTAHGYRRFRCRDCGRQFNERSGGVLNRTQYPSEVIALVVLWRLRNRLTLQDLTEMFLQRGIGPGSGHYGWTRLLSAGNPFNAVPPRRTPNKRLQNNRLEQDHRGVKGRIQCTCGFKEFGGCEAILLWIR
jgi:transposase-like protein